MWDLECGPIIFLKKRMDEFIYSDDMCVLVWQGWARHVLKKRETKKTFHNLGGTFFLKKISNSNKYF